MTSTRVRLMAVIGIVCLASSLLVSKTTKAPRHSILDTVYS